MVCGWLKVVCGRLKVVCGRLKVVCGRFKVLGGRWLVQMDGQPLCHPQQGELGNVTSLTGV